MEKPSLQTSNATNIPSETIGVSFKLSPITRFIFRKEDDCLLEYLIEDGRSIEPLWFIPIIPMVLVNGSEGVEDIETGWSSYVPNYNPWEIIANLKRLLNGENIVLMDPWYKGFRGTIEKSAKEGEYIVNGAVVEIDEQTFRITELPIGITTQDYKQFLESITDGSPNVKDPLIEHFRLNGDDKIVDIEIRMKADKIALIMQEGLLKKFKLTTTISTSNMYLLDAKGKIKFFDNPEQIMEEFFSIRLEYYEKRKAYMLANLERLLLILDNKVKFISGVMGGKISTFHCNDADLLMELERAGITHVPRKGKSAEPQVAGANDDNLETQKDNNHKEQEAGRQKEPTLRDYEYLLSLPFGTFTIQSLQELLAEKNEKEKEFDILKATPTTSLWMTDLDELEKMLDEMDSKEAEEERKRSGQAGKKTANVFATKAAKNTKKTINVEPENDNTSMKVENVVGVTKPKGEAASKKTQKDFADDDILSLQECLAAYNFESSSEKTGENVVEVTKPKGGAE